MSFTSAEFCDTNVLVYAHGGPAGTKHERARGLLNRLWEERVGALSVQVLQEFYVQATRATRDDALTHQQALGLVESFLRFPVVEITTGLVLAAAATRERFRISYWDAAILEAARSAGCDLVLSEDLDDRTDYAGVRVEDPFRDPGS
jgi:predicted nucleic acid-binding protein